MTFQDFIDKVGASNLAVMLQCAEATVYKWRNGQSSPRPETAFILTKLSHGQLALEQIFMPYIVRQLQGQTIPIYSHDGKVTSTLEFNF